MELPRSSITITITSAVKNVPAMKKNGNTVLDTGTPRRKMVGAIHSSRRRITMPLDKAIEHGKEKRKPYRGSKAFDSTCRNHGSCKWCEENRKHKFRDKHPENKEDNDV